MQDLACDVDMNKTFTNMTSGMIILPKTSAIKGASVTLSSVHYKPYYLNHVLQVLIYVIQKF